jgi:hypothetical protein
MPKRPCHLCGKLISCSNYSRHTKNHVFCDVCHCYTTKKRLHVHPEVPQNAAGEVPIASLPSTIQVWIPISISTDTVQKLWPIGGVQLNQVSNPVETNPIPPISPPPIQRAPVVVDESFFSNTVAITQTPDTFAKERKDVRAAPPPLVVDEVVGGFFPNTVTIASQNNPDTSGNDRKDVGGAAVPLIVDEVVENFFPNTLSMSQNPELETFVKELKDAIKGSDDMNSSFELYYYSDIRYWNYDISFLKDLVFNNHDG